MHRDIAPLSIGFAFNFRDNFSRTKGDEPAISSALGFVFFDERMTAWSVRAS
jgi:hypothetical protein